MQNRNLKSRAAGVRRRRGLRRVLRCCPLAMWLVAIAMFIQRRWNTWLVEKAAV